MDQSTVHTAAEHVDVAEEVVDERRQRLGIYRFRRADLLDPSAVHDDHPIGDLKCFLLIVRHEHARHVQLVVQPDAATWRRLRAHLGVERAERLVEQQHIGFDRKRSRERDALTLATRKLRGIPVCHGLQLHELENYVGVTEPPQEMFGKLMSISDELMWRYYGLLTDLTGEEVRSLQQRVAGGALHPKQAKLDLASHVVREFHTAAAAAEAAAEFERVHARRELPSHSPTIVVSFAGGDDKALTRLMCDAGLATSASEAARKVQQGGVRLDGVRVTDPRSRVTAARSPGDSAGRPARRAPRGGSGVVAPSA